MKRETKIFPKTGESQSDSEGSFWEVFAFAIFFVVVFTFLARTARAEEVSNPTPVHMQGQQSAVPSPALPDSNMAAGIPEPDTNKRFGWTSKLVVDTSGSVNNQEARSYSGEYTFSTGVTDQKTNIAAQLKAGYAREYSFELADGTDGDYVNPALSLTKTWQEGVDYRSRVFDSIVLGLSGVAGASHESARNTFVGSTGPSIGVTKDIHRLSLGQKFGYSRSFYNYDITNDGTVNAPDRFSSTTDASYKLTTDLALSIETILSYALNYQGTGITTEISSISLDYTISKLLATSIGVATKRGTISDDGSYNELKFIDGTVAQGFVDLIMNF